MLEVTGDIWQYAGLRIIVITTNGTLARDSRAVFGRGVARQASLVDLLTGIRRHPLRFEADLLLRVNRKA